MSLTRPAAGGASGEQKVLGMIGVAAHECGHINFSNFEKRRIYASGIREGILYPELPEPKNEEGKTGAWGIAGMSGAEKGEGIESDPGNAFVSA